MFDIDVATFAVLDGMADLLPDIANESVMIEVRAE